MVPYSFAIQKCQSFRAGFSFDCAARLYAETALCIQLRNVNWSLLVTTLGTVVQLGTALDECGKCSAAAVFVCNARATEIGKELPRLALAVAFSLKSSSFCADVVQGSC